MGVLDGINLDNVPGAAPHAAPGADDRRVYGPQSGGGAKTGGVLDGINLDNVPSRDAVPAPVKKVEEPGTSPRTNRVANEDVPDLSFGDVASGALHNLKGSAVGVAKGIGDAVMNPMRTLGAVGDLAKGTLSKGMGAMGVPMDPEHKEQNERVVNALMDHYKDRYSSWNRIKNTVATDPVGAAMDIPTPISLGAGTAANIVGKTGTLGKALSGVSKVAGAMDPVNAAVKLAGQVVRVPNALLKPVTSVTAQVPKSALDLAESAGRVKDPALRDAFNRHFNGHGDEREILDAAQAALDRAGDDASAEYGSTMAGQAAAARMPNYTEIQSASDYLPTHINGVGAVPRGQFAQRNALAAEIKNMVDDYAANPAKHNYVELDRLKRAVNDKAREYGVNSRSPAGHDVSMVTDEISAELNRIAPGYNDLMDTWRAHRNRVNDLTKGLGIGANANATTALAKMMRQQKTPAGRNLIEALAEHDPTLPYMLAGATLNPWAHGSLLQRAFDVGIASAGAIAASHPLGALSALSTSPKLMGKVQYGIGSMQRAGLGPKGRAGAYAAYESNWRDPLEGDKSPGADPNQPRGERNFNRGNIEDGPFAKSQPGYAGTDGRFAKFKDPASGDAASDALIQTKFRTGKDTVRKLISSWTPPRRAGGDNDDAVVEQKIAYIARKLGVNPDQRLDGSSSDLRRRMFEALSETENGAPVVRAARARGGRIIDHDREAQRLISAAESGLKDQNKTTEPLLNLHDDAVAAALKTADSYI